MKRSVNKWISILGALALVLSLAVLSAARAPDAFPPRCPYPSDVDGGPNRVPPVSTMDMIIHDQGNVVTTVDNWGVIGGWSYYGYPSGEFPKGSGRDYLAEIRYWMGAVTQSGDTLVANSYDDFQSVPSLVSSIPENIILLSTDTTRYYDYNPTDTTGLGYGNPAYGWRVWDSDSEQWVYTSNYNSANSVFYDGGPLSVQESHYRFNDAALGPSLLGLEMTHTMLQWDYCYNEDFLFVILEIKNTSVEDYHNFAFGLYVDIDVGGPAPMGENGRLGDLVAYDSTENLAWIYDADRYDEGWGRLVKTGVMGTKYLETPDDVGMTAFRSGQWDLLPEEDPGRYEMINSAQFDESTEPYDQYYLQCTRGIDLDAGKSIRVVFALIAGEDEEDFINNAHMAQDLYDNYFVGPEPPPAPTLRANARDEKVYLNWNDSAQCSTDPLSGVNDFAGYKLYRSENRGETWGTPVYNTGNSCQTLDYEPIATFVVNDPTDLIPRTYIDTGLINGVDYWYSLVAFDTGASENGVDVLQNGWGTPGVSVNTVSATPQTDPAGLIDAAGEVTHIYNGGGQPSVGNVYPTVFNRPQLVAADYEVVFEDTPAETYWHLINVTTNDTILANQTLSDGDADIYEVVDGLRVVVRNTDRVPRFMGQTTVAGSNTTLVVDDASFYGAGVAYLTDDTNNVYGDQHFRSDYELRYTGGVTLAPDILEYWYGPGPLSAVPFECWNTSTGERVSLAVYDFLGDGVWQPYDLLIIVNYPYDSTNDLTTLAFPFYYSWMFGFDDLVFDPTIGDVYSIDGPLMNGPGDVFAFSVLGDDISDARARAALKDIRVVPDPYYAYASQWEVDQGESVLQFQNLPEECTVRIYTLTGDLVRVLENTSGTGTVEWNLLTESQRLVASGIYIYHVESKYGDHLGRFAVVK